jgi:hypothetical protein
MQFLSSGNSRGRGFVGAGQLSTRVMTPVALFSGLMRPMSFHCFPRRSYNAYPQGF